MHDDEGAAFGPPFFMSFICHHWASDMRFKITGGTAIHEYAEECATATDALDRVRTMMASDLPRTSPPCVGWPCDSEAFSEAKTFRNSASGSMTRNNPASTQCNASLERCGEISTPSQALTKGWSNGQTEGHINRLKTLKRAMYGRAGAELLRARMLPLHSPIQHGK